MTTLRPSHSAWPQALVLVLVAVVGLQGMPLQALVDAPTSCICEERGFCPRDAEGDCGCEHHNHGTPNPGDSKTHEASPPAQSLPDGPVLQSCNTDAPDAVGPLSPIKWLVSEARPGRVRPSSFLSFGTPSDLASQRMVDDIFHPPWSQTA